MSYDRRDWEERELQVLRQEIAERLRIVCNDLPTGEFDHLVDQMARLQRKYERHRSEELFPHGRQEHI